MAAKDKVLNEYNQDALLRATGGQMKGAGFRKAKRSANKQTRVNKRARRKASRKGEQVKGGMYGYKAAEAESQKVSSYFDDLKTKRKQNATKAAIVAAGVAVTGGALATAASVAAAGTTATTAAGGAAAATTGTAATAGTAAAAGGAAAAGTTAATTAAVAGGTTAATTGGTAAFNALSNADKIAKVAKVGKQAKDIYDTVKPKEQPVEQPVEQASYNPLAGPIAQPSSQFVPSNTSTSAAFTRSGLYGSPMVPMAEQSYPDQNLSSPYEMGAVTDPRSFYQSAANLEQEGQGQSGLANIYKTGGRVKFKNT